MSTTARRSRAPRHARQASPWWPKWREDLTLLITAAGSVVGIILSR